MLFFSSLSIVGDDILKGGDIGVLSNESVIAEGFSEESFLIEFEGQIDEHDLYKGR